ncbi:MAG: choice-of-anchor V domain-containing protein [Pseudomonadota bacterium]
MDATIGVTPQSFYGLFAGLFLMAPITAAAHPDGAPWGSADDGAACVNCHFDGDVVSPSPTITIKNAPSTVSPGALYEFILQFEKGSAPIAGFLAAAKVNGAPAGAFQTESNALQTNGAEIRSTATLKRDGPATWTLKWQAPNAVAGPVTMHVAATAGNDDLSPFGDTVHYTTISISNAP